MGIVKIRRVKIRVGADAGDRESFIDRVGRELSHRVSATVPEPPTTDEALSLEKNKAITVEGRAAIEHLVRHRCISPSGIRNGNDESLRSTAGPL